MNDSRMVLVVCLVMEMGCGGAPVSGGDAGSSEVDGGSSLEAGAGPGGGDGADGRNGAGGGGGTSSGCAEDFCVLGLTVRPPPYNEVTGLVGDTASGGAAIFTRRAAITDSLVLHHSPGPAPTAGHGNSIGQATGFSGGLGTVSDFSILVDTNLLVPRLVRYLDQVELPPLWTSGAGACQGVPFDGFVMARVDAARVLLGGRGGSLCEFTLATGQTRLVRSPDVTSTTQYVTQIWVDATGEVLWGSDDGYLSELHAGRRSEQFDSSGYGVMGLSGTDLGNVWAVTFGGDVVRRGADGRFALHTRLGQESYGLTVTPEGVFVATFGGIAFRTAFTGDGFSQYTLPAPISPENRTWYISGGPGFLHLGGTDGNAGSPGQGYFLTLRPRTQ